MTSRRSFLTTSLAVAATLTVVPLAGCPTKDEVTNAINTALQDIDPIASIVDTIASIVLNAAGQPIAAAATVTVINIAVPAIKTGLVILRQLLIDYKGNQSASVLSQIDDVIEAIQGNIKQILGAIPGVPVNVATIIATGLGTVVSILSTVQVLIPPSPKSLQLHPYRAVAANAMVKPKNATLPTPDQIKLSFNSVLLLNGYAQNQIR